jgi:hypothetical protein
MVEKLAVLSVGEGGRGCAPRRSLPLAAAVWSVVGVVLK